MIPLPSTPGPQLARGRTVRRLCCLAWLGAVAAATQLSDRAPATAQTVPPDENWRQIATAHFVVTYPQRMETVARRGATLAERAYALLSREFPGVPDGPVQLLLTDHADISNGFASPLPYNQVTIFARPPMDGGSLSYFDDWLELVITHELVHTFHLDMSGTLGRALRKVFGRMPVLWPVFPSASTPTWVVEGLATHYESRLTQAGRVRGTWQDMVMRTAALGDGWPRLDQATGTSPVWPGGHRPYVYGARYLDHMARTHGHESTVTFARSLADLWVPYRLNAAARQTFGETLSDSWNEWESVKKAEYRDVLRRLAEYAPLTEGMTVDKASRMHGPAVVSVDGEQLAYLFADGIDAAQIRLADPDGSGRRRLTRVNGTGSSLSWAADGSLYFTQLEFADRYRLTSDIYRVGPGGDIQRVTSGRRITHMDVSPDGGRAVAVQEGGATNRLVMVDLATGEVSALTEPRGDVHWAHPRWSPDGARIAVTRWMAPGMMDIVITDDRARVVLEVTRDRAVDTTPFWAPDGVTLLWSSDRTGIANLFAATVGVDGVTRVRQVTNVIGGAIHPSVDRQARWIHFSSYHADGWHVERIPFDPDCWSAPQRARDDLVNGLGRDTGTAGSGVDVSIGAPAAYRALLTLRPWGWIPLYAPAETGTGRGGQRHSVFGPSVGAALAGRDLVGRHSYSLALRSSVDAWRLTGNLRYSFHGLGDPVLGLVASQIHDASSGTYEVAMQGGPAREFFLLERERSAMVTASFSRRRYRTVSGLALSGGLVRSTRTLQDPQGSAGPTLRLPPPSVSFGEARATVSVSNTQFRALSFSSEDGVRAFVSGRVRSPWGLSDEAQGVLGTHRGFQEVTGEISAFKAMGNGGFANHVLAARASAGAAFGPGANRYHYGVGGAEGQGVFVPGLGNIGWTSLAFPVRGYPRDVRFGHRAWSASLEYRAPLMVVDRGWGAFPLFVDRIHGGVFMDAGNAWGPRRVQQGEDNPRTTALVSVGAEVGVIVGAFYQSGVSVRLGWGLPLTGPGGSVAYVRAGRAF